jgi:type IV secretion system protein VirB9
MRGEGASFHTATAGDTTADPNLMISVPGGAEHPTQIFTLKALHHLEPQPFLVIGRYTHPPTGKQAIRRHVFETQTRPGTPMGEALDTFYSVLFADRVSEEVRAAKWRAQKEQREAQAADRVALAPFVPPGHDAIWHDGQRTFLRYPGNRRVPHA